MLKIDLSTFLAQYAPPNDHAISALTPLNLWLKALKLPIQNTAH